MPTTNFNRQILDLKRWEQVTPLAARRPSQRSFIEGSRHFRQQQLYVRGTTEAYLYLPQEDGWVQVPSPSPRRFARLPAQAGCSGAMSTGTTTAASTLTATGGSDLNDRHEPDARPRPARLQHPHRERPQRRRHADDQQQHNRRDRHHHRSLRRPLRSRPRRCTVSITPGVVRRRRAAHSPAGSFTQVRLRHEHLDHAESTPACRQRSGTDGRLIATPSLRLTARSVLAIGQRPRRRAAVDDADEQTGKAWTATQWVELDRCASSAGTGAGQIRTDHGQYRRHADHGV
jgi:hypothetical protein